MASRPYTPRNPIAVVLRIHSGMKRQSSKSFCNPRGGRGGVFTRVLRFNRARDGWMDGVGWMGWMDLPFNEQLGGRADTD